MQLSTQALEWSVGQFWHTSLDDVQGVGVYVVWYRRGADNPETVYVGQGRVGSRLAAHRLDSRFEGFRQCDLRIAWAEVPQADRGGVERYLAYVLEPKIGEMHPDAAPISVNLPFTFGRRIAERMITLIYDSL